MPKNLKELVLFVAGCYIGGNEENMKILGEGMKKLPNKLKSINLDISGNNLGDNP